MNFNQPQKSQQQSRPLRFLAFVLLQFGIAGLAFAGSGGGGLPWEGPLQTLANSLTGPVALGISIIAMAAAGGTLVFGGELGEFTRRALMLVLAISFLVFGAAFMTSLFGVSGALV